jgi:8-oxo-dGTP pyrophosphatase MutT (NUDIX family)
VSGFTKVDERLLHQGHVISLALGTFRSPDGAEFERELVRHPGAVSVVPLLDDGSTVVLVRQYRAAIDDLLLEIPAGKRDVAGEPPERTAARELEEEVGYRAGRIEELGQFYNSVGFSDEHSWVYLGRDLEPCASDAQGIEETHMTVEHVDLADVPAMVADGRLRDAKTIIGLTLTIERLRLERA